MSVLSPNWKKRKFSWKTTVWKQSWFCWRSVLMLLKSWTALEAHVKETYNILKKKKLLAAVWTFMMQEFNRESKHPASKSINAEVTNSAIELKVLIEQMREQIQNIE